MRFSFRKFMLTVVLTTTLYDGVRPAICHAPAPRTKTKRAVRTTRRQAWSPLILPPIEKEASPVCSLLCFHSEVSTRKSRNLFFFFFPDDLIQSRQNRTKSKAKPTPNQQNKLNQSKQKTKTAFSLNEPKRRVGEGRGGEGLFCMAVVMRP